MIGDIARKNKHNDPKLDSRMWQKAMKSLESLKNKQYLKIKSLVVMFKFKINISFILWLYSMVTI